MWEYLVYIENDYMQVIVYFLLQNKMAKFKKGKGKSIDLNN